MWNFSICVVLIASSIAAVIKYLYSYWRRNGVPEVKPNIPFGCMLPFIKQQTTGTMAMAEPYYQSTEPFVGMYVFFVPQLMIRDLELARRIMVQDFEYFQDHDGYINEKDDPISVNLFALKGKQWKDLRAIMTPLFTSMKLKSMYPIMLKEVEKLDVHLEQRARARETIDLRQFVTGCVINVVVAVLFGLEIDTIKEPNHDFKRMMDLITQPNNAKDSIRIFSKIFFPKLLELFKIKCAPVEVEEFFTKIVASVVEYRQKENIQRSDMIQTMIELLRDNPEAFSVKKIAGNLMTFFHAGTETTISTTLYCIYELLRNPEALKRASQDVKQVLEAHKGKLTYEAVQSAEYLDLCVKETLRLYTALAINNRVTVKDYKVPGHKFTIKKGTTIVIPVKPFHDNETYFLRPREFIPERFQKNSGMADERAYFPFGFGPRQCPAYKLGFMMTKLIVFKILSKYVMELLTKDELTIDSKSLTGLPKETICVKLCLE